MKKDSISFEVPRPRTRAHLVLFVAGSPFRGRTVENKKAYRRRDKHIKRRDAE